MNKFSEVYHKLWYNYFVTPFETAFSQLNPQQKQAVECTEGPVLVLAGPGTGKTQILSTRIAYILQRTQTQPYNILALTFTNAGAKNMQQRLVKLIGPTAYGVKCTTFHSFCADVIGQHPECFPTTARSSEAIADVDKVAAIEQILRENDFIHLKNPKNPSFYVSDCLHLIAQYKREGYSPVSLLKVVEDEQTMLEDSGLSPSKKRLQQKTIDKNRELAQIYAEYERYLREHGLYDYEDMILWVRDAFTQESDLLLEYQELYQYILLDEYQDTNQGQLQVIQELAAFWGENANIFAVGDPNQSIYRFQGASLSNTLRFLEIYPQATVISLQTGYRCGQDIYNTAAQIIAPNNVDITDERLLSLSLPLQSHEKRSGSVQLREAADTLAECFGIAESIQQLQSEGVPLSEIAVLYRKHGHVTLLQSVLERLGIPTQREGSVNVLEDTLVQHILLLFRFLVAVRTATEAPLVLPFLQLAWWKLPSLETLRLVRAGTLSSEHQKNPWTFLLDQEAFKKLNLPQAEAFTQLTEKVAQWQAKDSELPLPRFVELVLRESGFYAYLQQEHTLHQLNAVVSWLRQVQNWHNDNPNGHIAEFLQRLALMQEYRVALSAAEFRLSGEAVRLSTAHQAKGQEWEHVFLLHCNDGYWGNVRSPQHLSPLTGTVPYAELNTKEKNADERRLFFVALTRAKKSVHLSFSQTSTEGERTRQLQPSQFVAEIQSGPVESLPPVTPEALEARLAQYSLAPAGLEDQIELDRKWIQSLLETFALSASALNDLLTCPTSFLFKHVIRLPVVANPAASIGTATHMALEFFFRELAKNGVVPELAQAWPVVDRSLTQASLPESTQQALGAKVRTLLAEYYQEFHEEWHPAVMVEKNFGKQPPLQFSGMALTGKIDRIDLLDPALQTVRVVDYKTMAPKSRNAITGKGGVSDGAYWRQLLFYRILGESDKTFSYHITEGQLIFLEKNSSGKYVSETFLYGDEDLESFKELLTTSIEKIRSLAFLEAQPCGRCEMCKLLGLQKSELEEHLTTQSS